MVWTAAVLAAIALVPEVATAKSLREARAALRQDPPPAAAQALPAPSPSDAPAAAAMGGIKICCDRCIDYRYHCVRRLCCDCTPSVRTVLLVKDPCDCCFVEVPVCLPACCKDAPEVCCHKGVLGRSVVEYSWCCGFRVKIVFDRRGDVVVHSFGA
jgi:hypothetical protein